MWKAEPSPDLNEVEMRIAGMRRLHETILAVVAAARRGWPGSGVGAGPIERQRKASDGVAVVRDQPATALSPS